MQDMIVKNCIALGDWAQATDHDYQLTVATNGGRFQFTTKMTPEEFDVITRVVARLELKVDICSDAKL